MFEWLRQEPEITGLNLSSMRYSGRLSYNFLRFHRYLTAIGAKLHHETISSWFWRPIRKDFLSLSLIAWRCINIIKIKYDGWQLLKRECVSEFLSRKMAEKTMEIVAVCIPPLPYLRRAWWKCITHSPHSTVVYQRHLCMLGEPQEKRGINLFFCRFRLSSLFWEIFFSSPDFIEWKFTKYVNWPRVHRNQFNAAKGLSLRSLNLGFVFGFKCLRAHVIPIECVSSYRRKSFFLCLQSLQIEKASDRMWNTESWSLFQFPSDVIMLLNRPGACFS